MWRRLLQILKRLIVRPKPFRGTIEVVTDCSDRNAALNLRLAVGRLFGISPTITALEPPHPNLEASFLLYDGLVKATRPPVVFPSIIMVNCAPRGYKKKDGQNGTPFCWFRYGKTLVVSTLDAQTLSLVAHYLGVTSVNVTDVKKVLENSDAWISPALSSAEKKRICTTQFRSCDYQPLLAWLLSRGCDVPHEVRDLEDLPVERVVYWVDVFGNCKTALLPEDVGFREGARVRVNGKEAVCIRHLGDVEPGQAAMTAGSSGEGSFELVVGGLVGQSGADYFELEVGSPLEIEVFAD